jgi:LysM repeat protein
LILVWSQFARAQQGTSTASEQNGTANPAEEEALLATGDAEGLPAAGNATAEPTETITRSAPPTSAADMTISVFNPPADQAFAMDESIEFAWVWLTLLKDNEEFAVYVVSEDSPGEPTLVDVTAEPNNASLYLVESNARELDLSAGSYLWQVRLEDNQSGSMIVESDQRRFLILAEPTPTSTNIPPTATPTSSPTATEIPPSPTATATATVVACVPEAPFGWITHIVERGETPSLYAVQANVPVQQIFQANCLAPGAVLSVGQRLFIPPPLATDTPTPSPTDTPSPTSEDGGGSGGGGGGGDDDDNGSGSRPTSTPGPPPPGG